MKIYLFQIPQEERITPESYVKFDGETIKLYVHGVSVYAEPASLGDAYSTVENRGRIYLLKSGRPKNRGGIVAWLLKFSKESRTGNYDKIQNILFNECKRCKRHKRNHKNCEIRALKWENYEIYICAANNDTGYRSVAAWVSDMISKEEVLQLVKYMSYYPDEFVKWHLKEYFSVSESEYEAAKRRK